MSKKNARHRTSGATINDRLDEGTKRKLQSLRDKLEAKNRKELESMGIKFTNLTPDSSGV